MHSAICVDPDPTTRYTDWTDAHVDLVYAGLKCRNVVSIGKDSYINEQCGQQLALNIAWSRSKIFALHQTELYMPKLWTAIIVLAIFFFFKKDVLSFRIWWWNRLSTPKQYLLQELSVIKSNPFIRSLFRQECPFERHMYNSDQSTIRESSRKHAYIILTPLNPTFV